MKYAITILLIAGLFASFSLRQQQYIDRLSDEAVNTNIHFELYSYVRSHYPGCVNKMYPHLKWPQKYNRPSCG